MVLRRLPLDAAAVITVARATGFVVTVEEQSILGGLGGAVAEVLSEQHPVPVRRLGLQDCFGESGPNDQLLDKYRLSATRVAEAVEVMLSQRCGAVSRATEGGSAYLFGR